MQFSIYKIPHRLRLRISSVIAVEEELNVLDSAYYDINYYLASFDNFPLFLHFLMSLIKLILWLKLFHRQKVGWGHGGSIDHKVLLHFTWIADGHHHANSEPGSSLHAGFPGLYVCSDFLLLQEHHGDWIKVHPGDLMLKLTFWKALSPNTVTFWGPGNKDINIKFWVNTVQSIIVHK